MRSVLIIVSLLFTSLCIAAPTQWQSLDKGVAYTTINVLPSDPMAKIHAFKINLQDYRLRLALAKDQNNNSASVKRLNNINGGIIAINGGFFSPERKPLGLRIQDGKIRNPLKTTTSWWGIFYIRRNRAHIVPPKSFHYSQQIQFAVQAGPRLLVNGRIPSLKENFDERSALCVTRRGEVIIAATDNAPVSTTQLAKTLKKSPRQGGLGCYNALNLDGGTSTQLYAHVGKFSLYVPSFITVTDAIVVIPKKPHG